MSEKIHKLKRQLQKKFKTTQLTPEACQVLTYQELLGIIKEHSAKWYKKDIQ